MASMRKINGKYYARFYDKRRTPKRKTYPLRTTRKDVARRRLHEKERAFERGAFDPWNPDAGPEHLSLAEARARFLEAKSHLRPATLKAYRIALDGLAESAPPGVMLRNALPKHVRSYVMEPDKANATRRHRHRHLKAFFNWCLKRGLMEKSPLSDVPKPKKEKKTPAFLSTRDLERLLLAIDAHEEISRDALGKKPDVGWLRDMIRVAVCTGLRRGEAVRLRWQDVDLSSGLLHVRNRDGERTKSGHERTLPLAGDALEVLQRLQAERTDELDGPVFIDGRGVPVKAGRLSHRFKFFVRKAKLPGRERLHFHSLRHTCGSWLAMQGVPMRVIQGILGHSSTSVTEVYAHLQPEVMTKAMQETFG